jgi:hypothetical protein
MRWRLTWLSELSWKLTTFIADLYVLISKWVMLDPSDTVLYWLVQGDIKITNSLHHKKPKTSIQNGLAYFFVIFLVILNFPNFDALTSFL